MGLFSWLRGRHDQAEPQPEGGGATRTADPVADEWELVPAWVEAPEDEREIPTVIASAIAAGDRPDSEFTVRKVEVPNPEARLVTVIATAIAAGDKPDSEFVVRNVYRKKTA